MKNVIGTNKRYEEPASEDQPPSTTLTGLTTPGRTVCAWDGCPYIFPAQTRTVNGERTCSFHPWFAVCCLAGHNRTGVVRSALDWSVWRIVALPSAGVLDPTFGSGGIIAPSLTANAVLVQANNDIVLAGYTTTAKGTFISAGPLHAERHAGHHFRQRRQRGLECRRRSGRRRSLSHVGAANDGDIVEAVGDEVVRFNANGSIDTSFGKNGVATLPWSGNIAGVVIQANGEIVVSGASGTDTAGSDSPQRQRQRRHLVRHEGNLVGRLTPDPTPSR